MGNQHESAAEPLAEYPELTEEMEAAILERFKNILEERWRKQLSPPFLSFMKLFDHFYFVAIHVLVKNTKNK